MNPETAAAANAGYMVGFAIGLLIVVPIALAIGALLLKAACFFVCRDRQPTFGSAMGIVFANGLAQFGLNLVFQFVVTPAVAGNDPGKNLGVAGALFLLNVITSALIYGAMLEIGFLRGLGVFFMQFIVIFVLVFFLVLLVGGGTFFSRFSGGGPAPAASGAPDLVDGSPSPDVELLTNALSDLKNLTPPAAAPRPRGSLNDQASNPPVPEGGFNTAPAPAANGEDNPFASTPKPTRRGQRGASNDGPDNPFKTADPAPTTAENGGENANPATAAALQGETATLVADLKNRSPFRVRGACDRLAAMSPDDGRPTVAAELAALLQSTDPTIRQAGAKALGTWGEADAIDALAKACTDPSIAVRHEAMDSLSKLKDPKGVEPLVLLLRKDTLKASACLVAMGGVAEDGVRVALKDKDPFVRQEACKILEQVGSPASVPDLTRTTRDPERGVRLAAEKALRAVKAPTEKKKPRRF